MPNHSGLGAAAAAPPAGPLLPHACAARREEQAVHADKKRERAAVAAWRATVPATVACTLALFVQKAVGWAGQDSKRLLHSSSALVCFCCKRAVLPKSLRWIFTSTPLLFPCCVPAGAAW